MGHKSCFICCKDCFPTKIFLKEKVNSSGTADNESVNNHLQVIFLLRKLLEIPEDTCCKLLQHFGNPDLWIECCQSCLILVEQSQQIFDQILSLEKQYDQLRMNIKNRILKSQKTFDYQSKCEAIVRSHVITKDIDFFIRTDVMEGEMEGTTRANTEKELETNCALIIPPSLNPYVDSAQPVILTSQNASWDLHPENTFSMCQEKNETDNNFQSFSFSGKTESVEYGDASAEQYYDPQTTNDEESNPVSHNFHADPSTSSSNSMVDIPSCQICGETFEDIIDLQTHETQHTLAKPNECLICGKVTTTAYGLRLHMETHSEEKPYKCEICGKRFRQSCALRRHHRIHTGEKPHKCEICGREFIQKTGLKRHQMTHTGEKPFKCESCGKVFVTKRDLQRHDLKDHQKTHTAEIHFK